MQKHDKKKKQKYMIEQFIFARKEKNETKKKELQIIFNHLINKKTLYIYIEVFSE